VRIDLDKKDAQSFILGQLVKTWWACATKQHHHRLRFALHPYFFCTPHEWFDR
jgi:hypothetical protein